MNRFGWNQADFVHTKRSYAGQWPYNYLKKIGFPMNRLLRSSPTLG